MRKPSRIETIEAMVFDFTGSSIERGELIDLIRKFASHSPNIIRAKQYAIKNKKRFLKYIFDRIYIER